ncbi:MAG: DUF3318 domain-containing protein [Microcystaceae cyanobacterium]
MNPDVEIRRLLDVMPASGRMLTKIISSPQQSKVIDAPFPVPWQRSDRPIYLNFSLWSRLPQGQRDLAILRVACLLTNVTWFKLDPYQGLTVIGLVGLTAEFLQGDAVGAVVATSLTAIAANRVWRNNRSLQRELDGDESALKVALRRGYTEVEAARNLLDSIEALAELEGRSVLSFTELIRSQHLKVFAQLSPVDVPQSVKQYE